MNMYYIRGFIRVTHRLGTEWLHSGCLHTEEVKSLSCPDLALNIERFARELLFSAHMGRLKKLDSGDSNIGQTPNRKKQKQVSKTPCSSLGFFMSRLPLEDAAFSDREFS